MTARSRVIPDYVGKYREEPWRKDLDPWDRASLTVDSLLFTVSHRQLNLLVHKRSKRPSKAKWALPGVFVTYGERFPEAARRALDTKVGLTEDLAKKVWLRRVSVDNQVESDPRGWIVTMSYVGMLPHTVLAESLQHNLSGVALVPVLAPAGPAIPSDQIRLELPNGDHHLAFEHHHELVAEAVAWLRNLPLDELLGFLPEAFTLRDLQDVYEAIESKTLDLHTFRRRITKFRRDVVEPTGEHRRVGDRHVAALYRRVQSGQS